jgi:hypothetical protein
MHEIPMGLPAYYCTSDLIVSTSLSRIAAKIAGRPSFDAEELSRVNGNRSIYFRGIRSWKKF